MSYPEVVQMGLLVHSRIRQFILRLQGPEAEMLQRLDE